MEARVAGVEVHVPCGWVRVDAHPDLPVRAKVGGEKARVDVVELEVQGLARGVLARPLHGTSFGTVATQGFHVGSAKKVRSPGSEQEHTLRLGLPVGVHDRREGGERLGIHMAFVGVEANVDGLVGVRVPEVERPRTYGPHFGLLAGGRVRRCDVRRRGVRHRLRRQSRGFTATAEQRAKKHDCGEREGERQRHRPRG